jgi:two-component system response regulator NreC
VAVVGAPGILRSGLCALLALRGRFEVVSETSDIPASRRAVEAYRPDAVILELGGGRERAVAALTALTVLCPVVALAGDDDPWHARRVLQAGALGYVLKRSSSPYLIEAVRAAAEGRRYVDPAIGGELAALHDRGTHPRPLGLTEREIGVVQLVSLGYTSKQIADELHLSARTVETHRARILRKLGLHTRAELLQFADSQGLVHIQVPER